MQDDQLVALARNGDVEAFEQLIALHEKRIYNIALRTMKRHHDAQDAAQEAILKMYRSMPSFHGECSFAVWAYRVVVNTCLDELRARAKRAAVSIDGAQEDGLQLESPAASPEDEAQRGETVRLVRQAIDMLEADYRVALTLRDINGLSYNEIAEITGLALGTVKSRINRARAQIKAKLLRLHAAD